MTDLSLRPIPQDLRGPALIEEIAKRLTVMAAVAPENGVVVQQVALTRDEAREMGRRLRGGHIQAEQANPVAPAVPRRWDRLGYWIGWILAAGIGGYGLGVLLGLGVLSAFWGAG